MKNLHFGLIQIAFISMNVRTSWWLVQRELKSDYYYYTVLHGDEGRITEATVCVCVGMD